MTMRIDCHVHTARHSACSDIDPAQACGLALARGLSGLVFTEHHHQWEECELECLRQDFPGLGLYTGVEITLAEGHDMIVITDAVRLTLPPFSPFSALRAALAPVRERAFCFVAHAFRYANRLEPRAKPLFEWADGIEVLSVNILKTGWEWREGRCLPDNERLYQAAATRFGLKPVFTTDAHRDFVIGSIASDLPGPTPQDTDALVALLKRETPREFQDRRLLGAFLY